MSLRLLLDAIPTEKWRNEKVYFKKILTMVNWEEKR